MDKVDKKVMKKAFKEKEQREFEESLPMKGSDFLLLFDFLDKELDETDCDGGLSLLNKYCKQQNVNFDMLKNWFRQYGGFCDCEILGNVEEKFYYLTKHKVTIIQDNKKRKAEERTKLNSLSTDFGFSIHKVPSPWSLISILKNNVLHYQFQLGKKSNFVLVLEKNFDIEQLAEEKFLFNYWKTTKMNLDFVLDSDLINDKQSFGSFTINIVSSKKWTPALIFIYKKELNWCLIMNTESARLRNDMKEIERLLTGVITPN